MHILDRAPEQGMRWRASWRTPVERARDFKTIQYEYDFLGFSTVLQQHFLHATIEIDI